MLLMQLQFNRLSSI